MRRQPTIRGVVRRPVSSAFTPALNRAVEREMARYNVSRTFVLATCAKYALSVDDEPDYRDGFRQAGHKDKRRIRRR